MAIINIGGPAAQQAPGPAPGGHIEKLASRSAAGVPDRLSGTMSAQRINALVTKVNAIQNTLNKNSSKKASLRAQAQMEKKIGEYKQEAVKISLYIWSEVEKNSSPFSELKVGKGAARIAEKRAKLQEVMKTLYAISPRPGETGSASASDTVTAPSSQPLEDTPSRPMKPEAGREQPHARSQESPAESRPASKPVTLKEEDEGFESEQDPMEHASDTDVPDKGPDLETRPASKPVTLKEEDEGFESEQDPMEYASDTDFTDKGPDRETRPASKRVTFKEDVEVFEFEQDPMEHASDTDVPDKGPDRETRPASKRVTFKEDVEVFEFEQDPMEHASDTDFTDKGPDRETRPASKRVTFKKDVEVFEFEQNPLEHTRDPDVSSDSDDDTDYDTRL